MSFKFSHRFELCHNSDRQLSPIHEYGNINWCLEASFENENLTLSLLGEPQDNIGRTGVPWKMLVDARCTVRGKHIPEKRDALVCSKDTIKDEAYGPYLFREMSVSNASKLKIIPVTVHVSNIRSRGVRKFETINFCDPGTTSDTSIATKRRKLFCHSEILKSSSSELRRILRNCEVKEGKKSILIDDQNIPEDDFVDFLHHLYYPTEVIDEYNLKTLLHLGNLFGASQVLQMCQMFMESHLMSDQETDDTKVEYFLLSWKYDLNPLKMSCVDHLFLQSRKKAKILSRIFKFESYQDMNEELKHELWIYLLDRLFIER